VAEQIDALAADRGLAERLGERARADAVEHTWERAVEVLTRPLQGTPRK
jgi:hypothetical protein